MNPVTRCTQAITLALAILLSNTFSFAAAAIWGPASSNNGNLQIFFIDVEGGQATLFITPTGESLLVDTGWPGNKGRDADRIVSVAKKAGLTRIDFVLITHFHTDHVGGVPQLVSRIPVGTFIDHGINRELDHGITEHGYAAYQTILATTGAKHITLVPGDRLPINGLRATVISSDGNLLDAPLPGARGAGQPNRFCKSSATRPADQTENARSLGIELDFGKLRILDLGDLTWDKEMQLMCPTNKLGTIDILIVSHHGWDHSSSPALIDAIHPRVAIMDNGATKGGSPAVLETIAKAPGLETLWQLHYSEEGGAKDNTRPEYIANPLGPDMGNDLELTAAPSGSFTVLNPATHFTKSYAAKP
jgi:beta-lactamase superfamily II metal-dependent hydrolase